MHQRESVAAEVSAVLKRHFALSRVARISELAAAGRYMDAEALLKTDGKRAPEAKELDLLARLAVQQRHYDRACSLWKAALQIAPENAEFKLLLNKAMAIERNLRTTKQLVVAILIAVILAAFFILALNAMPGTPAKQGTSPTTPRSVEKRSG